MAGGVVRVAAKKVSVTREIFYGAVLALGVRQYLSRTLSLSYPRLFVLTVYFHYLSNAQGGMIWRSWHMSYKNSVDEFYKKYQAEQAAKEAS